MLKKIVAIVVFAASLEAAASPQDTESDYPFFATFSEVTFRQGDSSDSEAIPVTGVCSARYSQAGGDDAALYSVPTQTTAAASGTLIEDFQSSTIYPVEFQAGTLWVKAKATSSATGGSVMVIHCSNSQVSEVTGVLLVDVGGAFVPTTVWGSMVWDVGVWQ